jgi:hypothetical protein
MELSVGNYKSLKECNETKEDIPCGIFINARFHSMILQVSERWN